ncbi:MAG TPA: tripartite tricarboxylate transporter substrate binding protein [Candidatus Nesterenkonia stercoripullorum]|uniref:Tripartite tricarboxylate transporter substrate binding protein n=1 Tax=Candidatus Nesterenkonia stercoripullorum TaxID=2838701 RepID=A0A9D1UU61_9MICC|nr:tripartite tricarboxylate transporter substrate binding protein [Candidatus Nesterenkonia stercoripullorum]
MKRTVTLLAAGAASAGLVLSGCSGSSEAAEEEDYSASGTIRVVVSMAAGGGSDRATRAMSEAMNEGAEGYNTVVENREGGGGAVGWSYIHSLAGEPQHLVKAETAIHTLPLQDGVDVDWTYKDFTPIGMFAEDSRMLVAAGDSEYDTCADVIEASKTEDIFSGVSGTYGADGMVLHHMDSAGLESNTVPYGSSGEVTTGLLGGQIDIAPASAASVEQYIEAGEMKGLCTFGTERYSDNETLADIETAEEQGIDGTVILWRGFLAPPDISESARDFWVDEMKRAVETDTYDEYIESDLLVEKQLYGDEFEEYLDDYDAEIQEYFGD